MFDLRLQELEYFYRLRDHAFDDDCLHLFFPTTLRLHTRQDKKIWMSRDYNPGKSTQANGLSSNVCVVC